MRIQERPKSNQSLSFLTLPSPNHNTKESDAELKKQEEKKKWS